jgi:hypothetical protein
MKIIKGTWRAGIYENDSARDYMNEVINNLSNMVKDIMRWDGGADYTGEIADTAPADSKEYQSLYSELQNIGYKELHIIKHFRPVYR